MLGVFNLFETTIPQSHTGIPRTMYRACICQFIQEYSPQILHPVLNPLTQPSTSDKHHAPQSSPVPRPPPADRSLMPHSQ